MKILIMIGSVFALSACSLTTNPSVKSITTPVEHPVPDWGMWG